MRSFFGAFVLISIIFFEGIKSSRIPGKVIDISSSPEVEEKGPNELARHLNDAEFLPTYYNTQYSNLEHPHTSGPQQSTRNPGKIVNLVSSSSSSPSSSSSSDDSTARGLARKLSRTSVDEYLYGGDFDQQKVVLPGTEEVPHQPHVVPIRAIPITTVFPKSSGRVEYDSGTSTPRTGSSKASGNRRRRKTPATSKRVSSEKPT